MRELIEPKLEMMMKSKEPYLAEFRIEILTTISLFLFKQLYNPYYIVVDESPPEAREDQIIALRSPEEIRNTGQPDFHDIMNEAKADMELILHMDRIHPEDTHTPQITDHYIFNVDIIPRLQTGDRHEDTNLNYEITVTNQFGEVVEAEYDIIQEDERNEIIFAPFNAQYALIGHRIRVNLDRVHMDGELQYHQTNYQFALRQEENRDPVLVTREVTRQLVDFKQEEEEDDDDDDSGLNITQGNRFALLDFDDEDDEDDEEDEDALPVATKAQAIVGDIVKPSEDEVGEAA